MRKFEVDVPGIDAGWIKTALAHPQPAWIPLIPLIPTGDVPAGSDPLVYDGRAPAE